MVLWSKGDKVRAIDHMHLPPTLVVGNVYTVIVAVPEAGVVCLEEFGRTKTFPDHWFELVNTREHHEK
jgi:hypothetical protein